MTSEIVDSVKPIVGDDVFELRAFYNGKPSHIGFYNNAELADEFIATHPQYDLYITPQRIIPRLLERSPNEMSETRTGIEATKDTDVSDYKYILIDFDANMTTPTGYAKRPRGTSSTDEEHSDAIGLAKKVVHAMEIPEESYLMVDSGNGAHVYVSIESGIQKELIKNVVYAVKALFETPAVDIDTTVTNPARIFRAPGSMNNKGAAKRGCRYLIKPPEVIIPLSYESVVRWKLEEATDADVVTRYGGNVFEEVRKHVHIKVAKDGERYVLAECPFCHNTDNSAVIGKVNGTGGFYFKCHHNSCSSKKWKDLKQILGLGTSRIEKVEHELRTRGAAALQDVEVQTEISKIKASGELPKLDKVAGEIGMDKRAIAAAARKPLSIAMDLADVWIGSMNLKTDLKTCLIYKYDSGAYVPAERELAAMVDIKFRGLNTTSFIEQVLEYIRRQTQHEFADRWFALKNCMYNPETGETCDHNPGIVTRIKLDVAYDPDAKCPKWERFIDECKADKILLQEIGGFGLVPDYSIQKACMLLGSGGQGKSVFLRVITSIFGRTNVSSVMLQDFFEDKFASSQLYGKILNVAGDISDATLASSSVFKVLTGDDSISAQFKGKDRFEFFNRAKMIFSANKLPPTKDRTPGFYRRWVICEFRRDMVQHPNPRLAAELLDERNGIFNWMMEGASRLLRDAEFTYKTRPDELEAIYIEKSEPVTLFLKECCEEDESFESTIAPAVLYKEYLKWCRRTRKPKVTQREFVNAVKNHTDFYVEYTRDQNDKFSKPMVFKGLKLIGALSAVDDNQKALNCNYADAGA